MTITDNSAQISKILIEANSCKTVAIDTEFVWTKTYYPIAGLLQIAFLGEVYLLDLIIDDFPKPELKTLLENKQVTKLLHSPDQDTRLLHKLCGGKTFNLFDTQLAAAFLGYPKQLSLAATIKEFKDIEICKSQQVSDWTRRPLTEKQLSYAAIDVLYLEEISNTLTERLIETNRMDWFKEESVGLHENLALYEDLKAEDAYKKIKAYDALRPRNLLFLKKMAAYRLGIAERIDKTPNHILKHDLLLEAGHQFPDSIEGLKRCGFTTNQLQRDAKHFIRFAEEARNAPDSELPIIPKFKRLSSSEKEAAKIMNAALDKCAEEANLDPGLIASRAQVRARLLKYLRNDEVHNFSGWRNELFGDTFKKTLQKIKPA
jgi:ribonuclease D